MDSAGAHYLMLVDLKHDGFQYERGRGDHVQRLLGLGQPVDEVLQRVVEICGQRQGLFQFYLQTKNICIIPSLQPQCLFGCYSIR